MVVHVRRQWLVTPRPQTSAGCRGSLLVPPLTPPPHRLPPPLHPPTPPACTHPPTQPPAHTPPHPPAHLLTPTHQHVRSIITGPGGASRQPNEEAALALDRLQQHDQIQQGRPAEQHAARLQGAPGCITRWGLGGWGGGEVGGRGSLVFLV
jgi:hypothetical protein